MCDSKSNSVHSRPVCQFFASGQCIRGQHCRYLHLGETSHDDLLNQDGVSGLHGNFKRDKRKTRNLSRSSYPPNERSNFDQPICNHFLRNGWCRFGRECRYSHAVARSIQSAPTGKSQKYDTSLAECNMISDGEIVAESLTQEEDKLASSSNKNQTTFPNSKKLCRFYKAGFCSFGQRCRFKHITSTSDSYPFTTMKSHSSENKTCTQSFDFRGIKSLNSETSSDSGMVEDFIPRHKGEDLPFGSFGAISEADAEGEILVAATKQNCPSQCKGTKVAAQELPVDLKRIEIEQLKKRYPQAKDLSSDGQSTFQFVFVCTDPDWPYDVKEINLQIVLPALYPSDMMTIFLLDDGRLPETVRRLLTTAIQEWVIMRFEKMKTLGQSDLAFRPFLQWLDKNAEDLFTEALKEFRREKLAEISGVQFISASQLRSKYNLEKEEQAGEEKRCDYSSSDAVHAIASSHAQDEGANCREASAREEDYLSEQKNSVEAGQSDPSSVNPSRRGTEVLLQNLQLLNCAATIIATNIALIISCVRCSNKSEVKAKVDQLGKVECQYCHLQHLILFRQNMAHQFSSVIGYLDLEGCEAFDIILSDCEFVISCLDCSKDNKLQALSPGQPNTTWCFYCHQKLTVSANNGRFVKLSATTQIDAKNACKVELQGRVKAVKDPAIVEGKPLPTNGTCTHFKKSFRWFRFPCCGKAYPCDHCHDEKEIGHEMKRANRMICGFCAKEQPYTNEHPCVNCLANMTYKSTAHWEGGTGCRDKLKMSRGDNKKYTDSLKIASRSSQNKTEAGKKVTKLRHV